MDIVETFAVCSSIIAFTLGGYSFFKTKRLGMNIRGLVKDAYHMGYDAGFTKDQSRRDDFDKLIQQIK